MVYQPPSEILLPARSCLVSPHNDLPLPLSPAEVWAGLPGPVPATGGDVDQLQQTGVEGDLSPATLLTAQSEAQFLPGQPVGGQTDPTVQVFPFSCSFLLWRGLRYQVERIGESVEM